MFDKRKDNDAGDRQPARAAQAGQPSGLNTPSQSTRNTAHAHIGTTISVKGDLTGNEDVVIAGHFEGTVTLPSQSLTITQSGKVRADVRANVVEIQGEVVGDVEGMDKVLITPTGRMQGNIKSPRVILDDGAQFKGSIDMEPAPAPAAKPPARQAPPTPAQGAAAPRQKPGEQAARRGSSS